MWGENVADKISVNTGRMKTDLSNIEGNLGKISDYYQELIIKRTQLDAMWDGPTSETFKKSFGDDLVALMTMLSDLQRVYNYENMAKECYEACENQIAGVISDI